MSRRDRIVAATDLGNQQHRPGSSREMTRTFMPKTIFRRTFIIPKKAITRVDGAVIYRLVCDAAVSDGPLNRFPDQNTIWRTFCYQPFAAATYYCVLEKRRLSVHKNADICKLVLSLKSLANWNCNLNLKLLPVRGRCIEASSLNLYSAVIAMSDEIIIIMQVITTFLITLVTDISPI